MGGSGSKDEKNNKRSRDTNLTDTKDNGKPRTDTVGLSSLVTSGPQESNEESGAK